MDRPAGNAPANRSPSDEAKSEGSARSEAPHPPRRALGFATLVASTLTLAGMSLLVRMTKDIEGLSNRSVAFMRFFVGAAVVVALARARGERLRTARPAWLAVRGSFGAVAVVIYFYALREIGLAKGTVLCYTFPLWAAVLAPILIREAFRPALLAAVVVATGGLYLVLVPATGFEGVAAKDLVALLGGVLGGVAIVAVRRLRATDSSMAIFLSQCVGGLILLAYPFAASPPRVGVSGWAIMVAVGLGAAAGQLMMTYAYRHVRVSEGAPFSVLTPVWNVILAVLVFDEALTARGIAGGVVIIAACAYAATSRNVPNAGFHHGDTEGTENGESNRRWTQMNAD